MTDLSGKGAIVTGGGSGICFAFVKYLYEAGCKVLICDLGLHRDTEAWLKDHNVDIEDADARIKFQRTDVTDWKQLEETFSAFESKIGDVPDIVCPGAGVYEPNVSNFWNDHDEDTYKIFRINLEHPIKLSRMAIRKFLQSSKPRTGLPPTILLVSSIGAQKSSILIPLYLASKHAISSFTRCMGQSLFDMTGIRCVAIAPGPTASPLFLDNPEALKILDIEIAELCSSDEIARGMMAVLTDVDRYVPGTVLEVLHPDQRREVQLLNDPGPGGVIKTAWASRNVDKFAGLIEEIEKDKAGVR